MDMMLCKLNLTLRRYFYKILDLNMRPEHDDDCVFVRYQNALPCSTSRFKDASTLPNVMTSEKVTTLSQEIGSCRS